MSLDKLSPFLVFEFKLVGKADRINIYITIMTTLVLNALAIFIPLIQKSILDSIILSTFSWKHMTLLLIFSILNAAFILLETWFLQKNAIRLQQLIQKRQIEHAVRCGHSVIAARGAGAFMVGVLGNSEQLSNLAQTNLFTVFLQCIAGIIICSI